MQTIFENAYYSLSFGIDNALLYRPTQSNECIQISWPQFEINGTSSGRPRNIAKINETMLNDHIIEIAAQGTLDCGATLKIELRVCTQTPIIRFRYILSSEHPLFLTKSFGENLTYFSYISTGICERTEVRLSNFDRMLHSYSIAELPAFLYEDQVMGPILTEQRNQICLLTAYEHGSMYPDKFVAYVQTEDGIALKALRGNYWKGQSICACPYETIWLQLGAVLGNHNHMAHIYRDFQLKWCTLNAESRKPYIFYNSWCFQERNKFYNKQAYLSSMNQSRMETEIEIAHRMGVDVFVIDTGWYQKTGDWEANENFFPDGMESLHKKLESYGMKLGLWFNPTVAAKTSRILLQHPDSMAARHGEEPKAFSVWETEESYHMCLVSDYWETFADELIRLADTVGVRYFKWDGIGMYECERGNHFHGDANSSPEESRDCYAFRIVQYMSKVIDKLCCAYPDAIVDFDITEGMRSVGLAFLSSGKYFSINNGPYFHDYDIKITDDIWSNIFVHPGPARSWICRQNLAYDKWIPSVLFMTHYLPDDPTDSQMINLGSLILGQNGIWGDLPNVSEDGIKLFGNVLGIYKRVRDDITNANPVVVGRPGELFEVREKINAKNGRGVVVIFANHRGTFRYRMNNRNITEKLTIFGNATVCHRNHATWIEADFKNHGAAIIFFE